MPTFDDIDRGIILEREKSFNANKGPRVGDFIIMADGKRARFTHHWGEGLQTTKPNETGEGGSFYFSGPACSYSGALDPAIDIDDIIETGERAQGNVWIFHHGQVEAHNGVDTKIWFRVYRHVAGAKAVKRNESIAERYLLNKDEPFRGSVNSSVYVSNDGLERVRYTGSKDERGVYSDMTLEAYKAERGGNYELINEAELTARLDAYYDSLKTKPEPITEKSYYELLECLPPCRWATVAGWSTFHVSERLTGNLVQWCAKKDGRFYGWTDDAAMSKEALAATLNSIKEAA